MPKLLPKSKKSTNAFERLSDFASDIVGSPYWFALSVLIILIWFPTGFIIGFNEIWHLLINTFTTILTFLMMALLHSSQSKWEREIEKIQRRQERTLKYLERNTAEIKTNVDEVKAKTEIGNGNVNYNANGANFKGNSKNNNGNHNKENEKVISLF